MILNSDCRLFKFQKVGRPSTASRELSEMRMRDLSSMFLVWTVNLNCDRIFPAQRQLSCILLNRTAALSNLTRPSITLAAVFWTRLEVLEWGENRSCCSSQAEKGLEMLQVGSMPSPVTDVTLTLKWPKLLLHPVTSGLGLKAKIFGFGLNWRPKLKGIALKHKALALLSLALLTSITVTWQKIPQFKAVQ